jgi:phytanoyl-CoA hydroxylase
MSLTALGNEEIAARLYPGKVIHEALPHPDAVTDAAIEEFRRMGFLAVENVYSPQEVQSAKEALSFLIDGGNPGYTGVQFEKGAEVEGLTAEERELFVRKIMSFVNFEPRLKAMAEQKTLLSIVERILNSKAFLSQDMALLKPPRVGREKPWHQDTAYFLWQPLELIVGTWTALDPATVENGCMHVIPGSHLRGPMPHYHDRDCQMADEDVDVERDLVVPLNPGGVLFFSGLTHHGTPPNNSPSRRRALQYHYASVNCTRMDPKKHAEIFKDDHGPATCTAWLGGAAERKVTPEKPRG